MYYFPNSPIIELFLGLMFSKRHLRHKLIFFYQLKANYFTILQWFLSYIDMNQPWIYMYSPSRSPPHLPLHPVPLGLPSAPGPSTCLMHPTWTGHRFHHRQYTCFDTVLLKHPTLAFSHRVQKSVLYICVSFSVLHIGLSLPSF